MKIILDFEEVKTIVLARINADFVTSFDEVIFDGYSQFKTATVCAATKPEPVAIRTKLSAAEVAKLYEEPTE